MVSRVKVYGLGLEFSLGLGLVLRLGSVLGFFTMEYEHRYFSCKQCISQRHLIQAVYRSPGNPVI